MYHKKPKPNIIAPETIPILKKVFLVVKYKMNGSTQIKETETSYKVVI